MEHTIKKEIFKQVILKIPAGQASAKAPLGPTLGQYGIPIAEFCAQFNEETTLYKEGTVVKCSLEICDNDTHILKVLKPDFVEYLKNILNAEVLKPSKTKQGFRKKKLLITVPMLVELIQYYWENNKDLEYYSIFKKVVSQLKRLGVCVIEPIKKS